MSKPIVDVSGTNTVNPASILLLYDSGVKYDDPYAYYDMLYPINIAKQSEVPKISVTQEKIMVDSKEENIKINNVEEF